MSSTDYLEWREEVIKAQNGLAKLPCNLIRLLKVFTRNGETIQATRRGEMLVTPKMEETYIIHYYSLPTVEDEEGYQVPRLLPEYMDWYVWYIIREMLMDDWIEGKIGNDKWQWIENEYNNAYDQAIGNVELMSITDMEQQLFMMQNGIFYNNGVL